MDLWAVDGLGYNLAVGGGGGSSWLGSGVAGCDLESACYDGECEEEGLGPLREQMTESFNKSVTQIDINLKSTLQK